MASEIKHCVNLAARKGHVNIQETAMPRVEMAEKIRTIQLKQSSPQAQKIVAMSLVDVIERAEGRPKDTFGQKLRDKRQVEAEHAPIGKPHQWIPPYRHRVSDLLVAQQTADELAIGSVVADVATECIQILTARRNEAIELLFRKPSFA